MTAAVSDPVQSFFGRLLHNHPVLPTQGEVLSPWSTLDLFQRAEKGESLRPCEIDSEFLANNESLKSGDFDSGIQAEQVT
jgi:hypothetical protein